MASSADRPAFWTSLSGWKQDWLVQDAVVKKYRAGEHIVRVYQGHGRAQLYVPVIQTGWVKIQGSIRYKTTWYGEAYPYYEWGEPALGLRGPGDLLESMGTLFEEMHSGAVALTEVHMYWLSHFRLLEALTQHGVLEPYLAHHERVRNDELELARARAVGSEASLATVLLHLYSRRGGRSPVGERPYESLPPLTQADLAEMAGVSRATVARHLRTWRRAGIVRTERCAIGISRPKALEQLT